MASTRLLARPQRATLELARLGGIPCARANRFLGRPVGTWAAGSVRQAEQCASSRPQTRAGLAGRGLVGAELAHMPYRPRSWPTFAAEVLSAEVPAARRRGRPRLRADRQRLGLSQRAYAAQRGWTLATVIRLESAAGAMKLGDVDAALARTPRSSCACAIARPATSGAAAPRSRPPRPPAASTPPANPRRDAPTGPRRRGGSHARATRTRRATPGLSRCTRRTGRAPSSSPGCAAGGGRFPAHHVTEQVGTGPPWWWYAESCRAGSVSPDWYAPQYTRRRPPAS